MLTQCLRAESVSRLYIISASRIMVSNYVIGVTFDPIMLFLPSGWR